LLLGLASTSASAQTRRITGRVTSEGSNDPIVAASVSVIGTTLGGVTTNDGRFSINVPAGPVTLRVRRIGYTPKIVNVSASLTEVNVALSKDVLELDKQVITGTATTVASINAANAVTVVSGERLNRVPAQTIDNALQGKVPGAVISTNSGAPGGGTQVQIRGISTINSSFSPLYVVDGVIVSNASIANGLNVVSQASRTGTAGNFSSSQDQQVNRIADLNPNDIESIQVLKGPSASSIYGSLGTNGVIIITTKQGRSGKPQVDLTQRFGQSRLANKIGLRCFGSGAEVTAAGFTAAKTPGIDAAAFDAAPVKCHDYEEEFYNSNHSLDYQTIGSIRGGTDSGLNFFVSGLVQRDNGLALNDSYNKQSVRINLGQQFGTRMNFKANTEIVHTLTQRGVFGNDNSGINPYTTFSATPSFIDLTKQPDGTYPKNPRTAVQNNNPFQTADLLKTPENVYRLLGNMTGILNIFSAERQSLDFTLNAGIDSYNDHAKIISPATIYIEQASGTPGTLYTSDGNVVNANLGGNLSHRLITTPFTATTSVGFGQGRRQSDVVANTGRGVFPGVTNVSLATQTFINEGQSLVKSFSYFAQEEFLTLNERMLLTAGVTAERTSNNGDARKLYTYPKYSASYRLPWLPSQVNELKLRAAYGKAGNQPLSGKFTFLTTLFDEGQSGLRASTIKGFPGIKPETATETEGGFDITAFNGRLSFNATAYKKVIDDLLLQASIAPSTGFSSQFINGGQITNHGQELGLVVTPIQRGSFEWVSNTTFARERGKVTELPVPAFNPGVGSFSTRYGNAWIEKGRSPSVIQVVNGCTALNSSGACPAANRITTFKGDGNPDFTMGFSNDFNFGPIRVGTLLDWRKGGNVINLTNNYFDGGLLGDTAVGNKRAADWAAGIAVYDERATFVKLREVSIGYDIPAGLRDRLFTGKVSAASIELSGRNLKTWTPYTGLDPEVSNFSNQPIGRFQDVTPYPPSRTFYLAIHTTF
jgi:TonB-linked SusC/RagA family outer membrane protein